MWQRLLGRPRTARRLFVAASLFAAAVSGARALEGPAAGRPGLRGILPKEVPADLGPDTFSGLTGNWEKWGKGVSEMVTRLYTDEKLDEAGQRALLNQLHEKVRTIERALRDPRFESLSDPLSTLWGRLARRVDVDLAILDTLNLNPQAVKDEKIRIAKDEARRALAGLEEELRMIPNGEAWLPYIRANELRTAIDSNRTDGLVTSVAGKLNPKSGSRNPEQQSFLSRPGFVRLAQALNDLKAAQTAEPKATDENALRPKLTALVAAIESYEEDGGLPEARAVRQALSDADKAAIDEGTRLDEALRDHYLNYNLQVVASDEMLSKLVNDQRVTNGPVSDWILGAAVSGSESTTTSVRVQLQPGIDAAYMDLILNGVVQSSTVGVTDQASIYTQGYHRFGAAKPLRFDGLSIETAPARMTYVQPSNTTVGASTRFSGFPILGRIADRTAMNEANNRRGQSEAIAAQRVSSRVLPEFDQRVDAMIKQVDQRLRDDLRARLKKGGVLPDDVRARSNASYMRVSGQVIGAGQLGGDAVIPGQDRGAGLILHLHESLLNNAAKNMKFAGQTMTDEQVRQELERYLSLLAGRPIRLSAGQSGGPPVGMQPVPPSPQGRQNPPSPQTRKQPAPNANQSADERNSMLVFDKDEPIRFAIENGEISLIIRAGFKQPGKDDIPTQIITVPLRIVVEGNRVMVERGNVQVAAATQTDRATQVVRAGVMRKKLESTIQSMPLDPVIHIPRTGRPDVDLAVANIVARGGWLTIWAN